jgi:dihydrofolate reductase
LNDRFDVEKGSKMSRLRVHNFAVSLDGYGAGPAQSLDNPVGVGGHRLHEWIFLTRYGREMLGEAGGSEGVDHEFLALGDEGVGATIMGRHMFGPIRGGWGDDSWTGWWGEEPPYHHPVFVLTHHPRPAIEMAGGTTFHFVADGIEVALERARAAAGGKDVRLGGGAATIRQYLRAGLVDELHLAIVPVLLGAGERLFDGDLGAGVLDGYRPVQLAASDSVVHVRLGRLG